MTHTFSHRLAWVRSLFTVYTTTRIVKIKSKSLAITYVLLLVMVWAAFLRSYQLDLRRIYQKTCDAKGVVLTKVKGVISTEGYSDEELAIPNPALYRRVWDTEDIFKYSGDGFFITTNVIITANQTRGRCGHRKGGRPCERNIDCPFGKTNKGSNGIYDGICTRQKDCESSAWCPMEHDVLPLNSSTALLKDTKIFTVLIKNTVEFPECEDDSRLGDKQKYKRRNFLENFTTSYLKSCIYDPVRNPYCPIFNIGDIVEWAGSNYDRVAITGGVFRIRITWDCDFDWGFTIKECLPKYSFFRMDLTEADVSPGYNFRSAYYHEENRRTITKRYGLKFVIETSGEGRKFDFLILVLTIGASIGLFALAPLVCDFLFDLFCFLKTLGGPCHKVFRAYTEEIRYQDIDAHLNQLPSSQSTFEINAMATSKPL